MTRAIREYMRLRNSAIEDQETELAKLEKMNALIDCAVGKCEARWVTRFILDSGNDKKCIYECGYTDHKEKAFIISELSKRHCRRVFAVDEQIWEIKDES